MRAEQMVDQLQENVESMTFDLSKLEPRSHEWVQRGRFLSCRCHPNTGVWLEPTKNLVGIREDGAPIFEIE